MRGSSAMMPMRRGRLGFSAVRDAVAGLRRNQPDPMSDINISSRTTRNDGSPVHKLFRKSEAEPQGDAAELEW
jgi:hypothetical protein